MGEVDLDRDMAGAFAVAEREVRKDIVDTFCTTSPPSHVSRHVRSGSPRHILVSPRGAADSCEGLRDIEGSIEKRILLNLSSVIILWPAERSQRLLFQYFGST